MSDLRRKFLFTRDIGNFWGVGERHARRILRSRRFDRWRVAREKGQHGRFAYDSHLLIELGKGSNAKHVLKYTQAKFEKWLERDFFQRAALVNRSDPESIALFIATNRNFV